LVTAWALSFVLVLVLPSAESSPSGPSLRSEKLLRLQSKVQLKDDPYEKLARALEKLEEEKKVRETLRPPPLRIL
jgi:hypothetical protein